MSKHIETPSIVELPKEFSSLFVETPKERLVELRDVDEEILAFGHGMKGDVRVLLHVCRTGMPTNCVIHTEDKKHELSMMDSDAFGHVVVAGRCIYLNYLYSGGLP